MYTSQLYVISCRVSIHFLQNFNTFFIIVVSFIYIFSVFYVFLLQILQFYCNLLLCFCHNLFREFHEFQQLDLFGKVDDDKEIKVQKGIIEIKNKFGKNAVLRCSSLQDKATARIRNKLVGGHNGE